MSAADTAVAASTGDGEATGVDEAKGADEPAGDARRRLSPAERDTVREYGVLVATGHAAEAVPRDGLRKLLALPPPDYRERLRQFLLRNASTQRITRRLPKNRKLKRRLRKIYGKIGGGNKKSPHIVVIGCQSAGKSTALFRICGAKLPAFAGEATTKMPTYVIPTSVEANPSMPGCTLLAASIDGHDVEFKEWTLTAAATEEEVRVANDERQDMLCEAIKAAQDDHLDKGSDTSAVVTTDADVSFCTTEMQVQVTLVGGQWLACLDVVGDDDTTEAWGIIRAAISSPMAVRLVVLDGTIDQCKHEPMIALAMEDDPKLQRTVFIFTKIDMLTEDQKKGMLERLRAALYARRPAVSFTAVRNNRNQLLSEGAELQAIEESLGLNLGEYPGYGRVIGFAPVLAQLARLLATRIAEHAPELRQLVKATFDKANDELAEVGDTDWSTEDLMDWVATILETHRDGFAADVEALTASFKAALDKHMAKTLAEARKPRRVDTMAYPFTVAGKIVRGSITDLLEDVSRDSASLLDNVSTALQKQLPLSLRTTRCVCRCTDDLVARVGSAVKHVAARRCVAKKAHLQENIEECRDFMGVSCDQSLGAWLRMREPQILAAAKQMMATTDSVCHAHATVLTADQLARMYREMTTQLDHERCAAGASAGGGFSATKPAAHVTAAVQFLEHYVPTLVNRLEFIVRRAVWSFWTKVFSELTSTGGPLSKLAKHAAENSWFVERRKAAAALREDMLLSLDELDNRPRPLATPAPAGIFDDGDDDDWVVTAREGASAGAGAGAGAGQGQTSTP